MEYSGVTKECKCCGEKVVASEDTGIGFSDFGNIVLEYFNCECGGTLANKITKE